MSDDRELLGLAAKAAGMHSDWEWTSDPFFEGFMLQDDEPDSAPQFWNPLADDGDALRLAVKLNINPQQYPIYLKEKHSVIAVMHIDIENDTSGIATYQECGGDPYAATRRAIVRAAAEIGKQL